MNFPAFLQAPTDLCVGLSPSLICFDSGALSFSWSLPYAGYQVAYRITVFLGESEICVFDSGWVEDSQNTAVIPKGLSEKLVRDRLYTWRVSLQVRSHAEGELMTTDCSEPSYFVTSPNAFKEMGLWAGDDYFAMLRSEFELSDTLVSAMSRAVLTVTAASPEPARQFVYHAYLNGQSVGLGPSRTDLAHDGREILYAQSFDVTQLLSKGLNCLGAICGTAQEKAFICRLTAYGRDGLPTVLASSDQAHLWQALAADAIYRPDHSIGTHYFKAPACNIDGALYPYGFSVVGFNSTDWQAPSVRDDLSRKYLIRPAKTANIHQFFSPKDIITVKKIHTNTTLVDLGREIVGGFGLTLPCCAPADITLSYGEELTPDGHVLSPMRTGNHYLEHRHILPDHPSVSPLSLMTYRYVEISGAPVDVTPDMVQGLEFRANFDENAAEFTCNHPLLARIWDLVKHTVKVTTQDLYVDSQSRERTAYEGDLLINLMAAYACGGDRSVGRFTTDYLFTHRTWPAEYPLFVILSAWEDYMATGDITLLSNRAQAMKSMLYTQYMDSAVGLIASPSNQSSVINGVLVDWPPSERDGYDITAPFNTVFNALCALTYDTLSNIFSVLGDHETAASYAALYHRIKDAMILRLYDPSDGGFFDGCSLDTVSSHKAQHATAFSLFCGIYESQDMKDAMAAFLSRQGEIRMSVYGAYFLLAGLYKAEHGKITNRLLLSEDASEGARTWAYMLDTLGATVTTEAWNRRNKPNMTYSHPWGAAPAHMIATGIMGITPTAPGYKTFHIRPCVDGVEYADYTLRTVKGSLRVSIDSIRRICHVVVPFNTTATLYLPDGCDCRKVILAPGEHYLNI